MVRAHMTKPRRPIRARHRRRRTLWRAADVVVGLFALIGIAAVGGFVTFAATLPRVADNGVRADAIVALTGGAERLNDAMALLGSGHARRMLISGVNPATNETELARVMPGAEHLLDCCVDLDPLALNTAGNAVTTRAWVRDNGYRSVILVTSGWHMRRARMELERSLPDVAIVPYPVVTGRFRDGSWWRDGATLTLVVTEYVKYVAALARLRLAPQVSSDTVDLARGHPAS